MIAGALLHPSPPGPASADATLAQLWERVRRRGDMPGFAKAISAILGAMRGGWLLPKLGLTIGG